MALLGIKLNYRDSRSKKDAEALGEEWCSSMPNEESARVVEHDDTTAYGEIRLRCPLQGTGWLDACDCLMSYDRALVAPSGGRLVVIRSQARV